MDIDLLFVNKSQSSGSLTQSAAGERVRILSHVQAKRRKAETRYRTQPWSKYVSILPDSEVLQDSNVTDSSHENRLEASSSIMASQTSLVKLGWVYPAHNASDPFRCTVAGDDVGTHAVLQFAFFSAAKTTFLAESFAPTTIIPNITSMRHDEVIEKRLRRCIDDSTLMYASLAYGWSVYGWVCGLIDRAKPPEYFVGKALHSLRQRLVEPDCLTDTWLLLTMYSLAITEMWASMPYMWNKCRSRQVFTANNPEPGRAACRMHMKALLRAVEAAGGWHMFDPYVLESAILADKFLALHEMQRPIIALSWDPGAMPTEMRKGLKLRGNTLSGLGRSLLRRQMSHQLREAIQHVVLYIQTAYEIWFSAKITVQVESWLFLRLQALVYQLLLLEEVHLDNWDGCISITALGFLLSATQYRGASLSVAGMSSRLREKLTKIRCWEEESDTNLKLWCLYMGAMMTESSLEREWFATRIVASSYENPASLSDDAVARKLESYLFIPSRQSGQLVSLLKYISMG